MSKAVPKVCHGFLVSPFDGVAMNIELQDGTLIKGILQNPATPPRRSQDGPPTPSPSPQLSATLSQGNLRLLSLLSDDEYDEEMGYVSALQERPVRVTVVLHGTDTKHRQLVDMFDADGECINWILCSEGYVDMLF
jgi:hypothetical protein